MVTCARYCRFLVTRGASGLLSSAYGASAAPEQAEPGVCEYKDTCNVYAIVQDGHAILIEFAQAAFLIAWDRLAFAKCPQR